jgi:L-serine dehydratase
MKGMPSIRELYRIGHGPSASHTMGPRKAAEDFLAAHPCAARMRVTLHGSLAATGKGHLTDKAITDALSPVEVTIEWRPNEPLSEHPNGMTFEAFDSNQKLIGAWRGYSIGGGEIRAENSPPPASGLKFENSTMAGLLEWAQRENQPLWAMVEAREGVEIWDYLSQVWTVMEAAISRGLRAQGVLPGGLGLSRKARAYYSAGSRLPEARSARISAYALAVAEENASGGEVVTAPTCGSCAVLPAVLHFYGLNNGQERIRLEALAIAGLVGNMVKTNASISGAQVGCQGEIGTACAMAAAAGAYIMGATNRQIEYAAEMGLEHHLGLTCDPMAGLVQIPCIERNAMAAMRAVNCAEYAMLGDGNHVVSFDNVVAVMNQTGHDLPSMYRETAMGGLANINLSRT